MSTSCKYATAAEAHKANWFSRRHQTSGPHHDASQAREDQVTAQFQATQERIKRQDEAAAARTPEQIARRAERRRLSR